MFFTCTRCGACCTGAPGRVRVGPAELRDIAAFLGEEPEALTARVTRPEEGGLGLRERANGDCVFFANEACAIHPVKPRQCRLFPFWYHNTRGAEAWRETRARCPGLGTGEWISPAEILRRVREDLGAPI